MSAGPVLGLYNSHIQIRGLASKEVQLLLACDEDIIERAKWSGRCRPLLQYVIGSTNLSISILCYMLSSIAGDRNRGSGWAPVCIRASKRYVQQVAQR